VTHPVDDDDLRTALHEAVSDVQPSDGLDLIRSRTKPAKPAANRWLPLTAAAAAAVVLVIGGTAWVAHVTSDDSDAVAGPGHRQDTARTADAPARDLNVPVTYVGSTPSGPRLFTEHHEVSDTTATPLQAGVTEALLARPEDPDYTNYLHDLGVSAHATESGGSITIDLSNPLHGRPGDMDAATAEMVVQSLVWTADTAASAGLAPVTFTVDGQPVEDVLGVDARSPIAPASADSVLAPVSIESPANGATVVGGFNVRGMAATFEANVVWELEKDGHVVQHGFTTASQCCTLSPYDFTVTADPGHYTLVVHDTDESDGEGVGTSQDTKVITVR
jgi:hypothetical protein